MNSSFETQPTRISPGSSAEAPIGSELAHIRRLVRQQRYEEALAALDRLEPSHSRKGTLYQERGHCHLGLKDPARAIEAFRLAVSLNPALAISWQMLQQLSHAGGDMAGASAAASQLATLRRLPPAVVAAGGLFSEGDLVAAERLLRPHVAQARGDVEALRLLARIAQRGESLLEAEELLAVVVERSPTYWAARADYARVLIDRQKYPKALDQIGALLDRDPRSAEYRALEAAADAGLGDQARALAILRDLLEEAPGSAELAVQAGHCARALGLEQDAIGFYRQAAAARPGFGDAYWSLANLKTHVFCAADVAAMRSAESMPGCLPADRLHLNFALGKAFEDRGDYESAWRHYERGNALKRSSIRYRSDFTDSDTRRQIGLCTPEFFESRTACGAQDPDPIFIVGLPRSGSTLVEQILASHSQMQGLGERAEVHRIVRELAGTASARDEPRYPSILATLSPDQFGDLGRRYLAETRSHRRGRPFFIDKMPNNFRHLGLIHLMLPNARIIDVRRDAMPCCVANLKQLYARGQEWSYGIADVAAYYADYLKLMRHWDTVLPGKILRIRYEDVVDDLEGSVRRLLGFCGLHFETACVEFHATSRSVATPSSGQVRQPIYRSSLDHWRNFQPWLGPLEQALNSSMRVVEDSQM